MSACVRVRVFVCVNTGLVRKCLFVQCAMPVVGLSISVSVSALTCECTLLLALIRQLLRTSGIAQVWRSLALAISATNFDKASAVTGTCQPVEGATTNGEAHSTALAACVLLAVALELPCPELSAFAEQVCVPL